jgi:hypothetical protein
MKMFAVAFALALVAGVPVAAAQSRAISNPVWAAQPTMADRTAAYSAAAGDTRVFGEAILDCLILPSGALDCVLLRQSSASFGAAALSLAAKRQAAPTMRDGQPTAGARTLLTERFGPWLRQTPTSRPIPRQLPPGSIPVAVHPPPPPADLITQPVWRAQPSAEQFAAAYPERARGTGLAGDITFECVVGLEGLVHCSGHSGRTELMQAGFGAAAQSLIALYRSAETDAAGAATQGRRVDLVVTLRP